MVSPGRAVIAALQLAADDVDDIRPELLAVEKLLQLASADEGLDKEDCRGLFLLVGHITLQAVKVERAFHDAWEAARADPSFS